MAAANDAFDRNLRNCVVFLQTAIANGWLEEAVLTWKRIGLLYKGQGKQPPSAAADVFFFPSLGYTLLHQAVMSRSLPVVKWCV